MKIIQHGPARRRVELNHGDDFECVLLASFGLSTKAIQKNTGLSGGQINYRLKLANVKRASYRDGTSAIARKSILAARDFSEKLLLADLAKIETNPNTRRIA